MVFFTCNHCGESVKKPAVEKHYFQRCRSKAKDVSCMDCLKDFRGEEYAAHTKCISEAEKYSGKDYVPKENKNSGAKKQESWMEIIRSILDSNEYNLSPQARSAFQRLQSVDNVPRKKAKFQNFVANCMRMPKQLSEVVWDVLEKEQEKMKQVRLQANQENGKSAKHEPEENAVEENEGDKLNKKKLQLETNGTSQNGVKREAEATEEPARKKSKKQKSKDKECTENEATSTTTITDLTAQPAAEESEEFQWSSVLEKILGKHPDGIAIEKLKKKLLKKYTAKLSLEELTEQQQKKFEKKFTKKLKKSATVQMEGDIIKPCR